LVPESPDGSDEQSSDIFARVRRPRPRLQGRRSHIEMMVHVLDAIRSGADKPTRVMYKSNLSWSVCQSLLSHLAERGFVKVVPDGPRRRYELTLSGSEVLSSFTRVAEAISA
jgi:predicted transcriptional regulator